MDSFILRRFDEGGKNGRASDLVYCFKGREILTEMKEEDVC
jgi:hypothetical protein